MLSRSLKINKLLLLHLVGLLHYFPKTLDLYWKYVRQMGHSWVVLNQQIITSILLCGNGSFVAATIFLLMVKV